MNNPLKPEPQPPDRSTDWSLAICQGREDEFLSDIAAVRARAAVECQACPVRDACLARAMANGEKFGVWGGRDMTPSPANTKLPRCHTCLLPMRRDLDRAEDWPGTVLRESGVRCHTCARKSRASRSVAEQAEADLIAARRAVLLGLA